MSEVTLLFLLTCHLPRLRCRLSLCRVCSCRVVLDLARSAADESEARAWADDTAFLAWAEGGSGASIIAAELKVWSESWHRALPGQGAFHPNNQSGCSLRPRHCHHAGKVTQAWCFARRGDESPQDARLLMAPRCLQALRAAAAARSVQLLTQSVEGREGLLAALERAVR